MNTNIKKNCPSFRGFNNKYMIINDFPDMHVELRISDDAPCIAAGLMEYLKKGEYIYSVAQTYALHLVLTRDDTRYKVYCPC